MNLVASHQTMSSREIAELTGKRHDNVMRTINDLAHKDIILPQIEEALNTNNNQLQLVAMLNKRDSLVLVARLSPEFTAAIVDRWQELEQKELQPALPTNYIEALESLVQSEKEKAIAIEQLQEARPKVEYHDRVLATENGLTTTEIAAELGMSAIALNRKLKDAGIQRKIGNRWCLRNDYLSKGYTVERTFIDESETSRHSMAWTEAGRKFIHEMAGAIQ